MTCDICIFAKQHGHWPEAVIHCDDCHRSWHGLAEAHCPQCCAHFTSDSAFDLHLTGDGCKDPATARRKNGFALYRLVERFGGSCWSLAPAVINHYAREELSA